MADMEKSVIDKHMVVVSITPLRLSRDSRTLKIANSFIRFGFQSFVIENLRSLDYASFRPVLVRSFSLFGGQKKTARLSENNELSRSLFRIGVTNDEQKKLKWPWRRWLFERMHFFVFCVVYFIIRPMQAVFIVEKADIYYLHEYRLYPIIKFLEFFRGKVPFIYDAHDFYPKVFPERDISSFWKRWFVPLLRSMERRCIENAAAVVTVSHGCADLYENMYGIRPVVVRNCHDTRLDKEPPQSIRILLSIPDNAFLVVVVGNKKPGQAVTPFLTALGQVDKNIHVAFVGRHHESTRAQAVQLGLENRVHTPGSFEPEQIVPIIRSADMAALLYFSETENVQNILPNGFFQSITARLPLLYPRLPEIVNVIGEREVGYPIDPLTPKSIQTALTKSYSEKEHGVRFRENLELLASMTSWKQEEKKLRELIERVLLL